MMDLQTLAWKNDVHAAEQSRNRAALLAEEFRLLAECHAEYVAALDIYLAARRTGQAASLPVLSTGYPKQPGIAVHQGRVIVPARS